MMVMQMPDRVDEISRKLRELSEENAIKFLMENFPSGEYQKLDRLPEVLRKRSWKPKSIDFLVDYYCSNPGSPFFGLEFLSFMRADLFVEKIGSYVPTEFETRDRWKHEFVSHLLRYQKDALENKRVQEFIELLRKRSDND